MDIIISILALIGVVFMIDKIGKLFKNKMVLEAEMENNAADFSEFADSVQKRLDKFQKAYNELNSEFTEYRQKTEKAMDEASAYVENILTTAEKIVNVNRLFYRKIELLDQMISEKEPSQEELSELATILKEDIAIKQEYETYFQELRSWTKDEMIEELSQTQQQSMNMGDNP